LRKSIIFPQACFPAVSFSRRRLCIRSQRNRTRSGTPIAQSERSVPGTSSDGTGEARRTSYRPGAPGSLPVLQLRYVVRLEFSGSFGPMQRGAEPRCRGAPNWIVHNTNHWAAVRPNMIPGKIRVPTLILHAKWDDDPPLLGSERRAAQKHFLRSYDRVAKELVRMERNWMQLFRALTGHRSCAGNRIDFRGSRPRSSGGRHQPRAGRSDEGG
jgi:pimeloyl-ACP methyl ester carboxylesterase